MQQNLKEIGIEVTFEVLEWNALLGIWREGAQAPSNRGVGAFDPFTFATRFLKTGMVPPAANNWGYFSDSDHDALMTRIHETFEPGPQQLHEKAVDDRLFLFVAHGRNPRSMSRKVKGFVQAQSWFQDLAPITLG